ncbi:3-keto-5-aminohexanoate cleavage protein [Inquilinus limosus]|uniref:3-keto-5-aminohexanoate cleavage protein n=1 Tax=Inquilinus limosus TaxID=171674 RepID=A0A211ZEM7_9PROT|nr:3-keto-5-aminohexanoate cleavage protein [Inquilinus limosus]OWJ63748.1 hypothetical protein BWR60_28315 [Inquilinus limosus]
MKKLIIEVRPNENAMRDANPHVPWSAEEIGRDAAECRDAGASMIHFHARTSTGGPNHSTAGYGAAIAAIRDRCDLLLAPSLANAPGATAAERIGNLRDNAGNPHTRSDFLVVEPGSVNLDLYEAGKGGFVSRDKVFINSYETVDFFLKEAKALGFAPYLTSFNVSWTRAVSALLETGAVKGPAPLLLVFGGPSFIAAHPGNRRGLEAQQAFLPQDGSVEWIACCHRGSVIPIATKIIAGGGHISIGLGDHPYREFGQPSNADLVRHIARMARAMGREVATPQEARAMLGLA